MWFFTFNNPEHPLEGELLYYHLSQVCRSFGFQYEAGENGTPHYQGEVQLLKKTRYASEVIVGEDDCPLFPQIHWEPTRNPGAARKYCGKDEGRLDGPWRYGQNGAKGGGYGLALEAKSQDEALQIIKTMHPRDWFNNGDRIRANVIKQFERPAQAFVPRAIHSFKSVPAAITRWYNEYVAAKPGLDRYQLLVVVGPTKLGKTQLIRSLGKHLYWKGLCKLDELKNNDYDYLVLDDIPWKFVPEGIKKSVLLGTGDCIVTDRYVKKLRVMCDKPCVYVCNPPDAYEQNVFYDCDPYWKENCTVVKINNKLY